MLQLGMRLLGAQVAGLATMPSGQTEKQVLAWWLRGRTTVTRQWIAERLRMGYETRVSQAVSWVESTRARDVVQIRKTLTERGLRPYHITSIVDCRTDPFIFLIGPQHFDP